MMCPISVAIDGPAGAGKSTVAREVAARLRFLYVDTGAMYRAITYLCVQQGVDPEQGAAIEELLKHHSIEFIQGHNAQLHAVVDGLDVTHLLRNPEVSERVSAVAAHPAVRTQLTRWQQAFAQAHSVVMDGRDIGTVVLPNATVKVFLTADVEERARRRQSEYRRQGFHVALEEIVRAVSERDRKDSEREVAPLSIADDAVKIDSTGKSVEEIVNEILQLVAKADAR